RSRHGEARLPPRADGDEQRHRPASAGTERGRQLQVLQGQGDVRHGEVPEGDDRARRRSVHVAGQGDRRARPVTSLHAGRPERFGDKASADPPALLQGESLEGFPDGQPPARPSPEQRPRGGRAGRHAEGGVPLRAIARVPPRAVELPKEGPGGGRSPPPGTGLRESRRHAELVVLRDERLVRELRGRGTELVVEEDVEGPEADLLGCVEAGQAVWVIPPLGGAAVLVDRRAQHRLAEIRHGDDVCGELALHRDAGRPWTRDPREVVAQEVADVGRDLPSRWRRRHQALGRRHEEPYGIADVDSVGAELVRNGDAVRLPDIGRNVHEVIARQVLRSLRRGRVLAVLVRGRTEPVPAVQGRLVRSEDVLEHHDGFGRRQVGATHLVAVVVQRQDLDGGGGRRSARRGRRRGGGGGRRGGARGRGGRGAGGGARGRGGRGAGGGGRRRGGGGGGGRRRRARRKGHALGGRAVQVRYVTGFELHPKRIEALPCNEGGHVRKAAGVRGRPRHDGEHQLGAGVDEDR